MLPLKIQFEFAQTLTKEGRLQRLLTLEKERRGVCQDALVFIGMANVAKHKWCTQEAVMKSRCNEIMFFGAYLQDRINRAIDLGRIDKVPRKDAAILSIGEDIKLPWRNAIQVFAGIFHGVGTSWSVYQMD